MRRLHQTQQQNKLLLEQSHDYVDHLNFTTAGQHVRKRNIVKKIIKRSRHASVDCSIVNSLDRASFAEQDWNAAAGAFEITTIKSSKDGNQTIQRAQKPDKLAQTINVTNSQRMLANIADDTNYITKNLASQPRTFSNTINTKLLSTLMDLQDVASIRELETDDGKTKKIFVEQKQ